MCAGELIALLTLTNVLNYLKVERADIRKLTENLAFCAFKGQKEINYQFEDKPEATLHQMHLSKQQILPPLRWPLCQSQLPRCRCRPCCRQ